MSFAAAETLNRIYRHERENDIGNTSYDYVEQNVAQRIAGRLEYLLCVIEYHIRATPLLEHGNNDAYRNNLDQRTAEQRAQAVLLFVAFRCGRDGLKFLVGILLTAYTDKYLTRLGRLLHHCEPSRTLRNEEHQYEKSHRRKRSGPEHPAPPHLAVPCINSVMDNRLSYQPIGYLCSQYSQNYRQAD